MTHITIERAKLEQALAALEGVVKNCWRDIPSWRLDEIKERITTIKQAFAAPVQEPVAILKGIDEYGPVVDWYRHWITVPIGTKLYTTPPPAEFVCSTGLCHYKALPDAIHHTDLSEHPEYISGWNDYRAAMMEMMK